MQHVAGLYLQDRITLEKQDNVIRLLSLFQTEKSDKVKKYYLRQCVSWLTTKIKPRNRDIKKLDKILEAAGFQGKKEEVLEDTSKALLDLCTWIGARLGKTPYEIKASMTCDEIEATVKSISRKILEENLSMLRAQHSPIEFGDEIIDNLRELSKEISNGNRMISREPVEPKESKISMLKRGITASRDIRRPTTSRKIQ